MRSMAFIIVRQSRICETCPYARIATSVQNGYNRIKLVDDKIEVFPAPAAENPRAQKGVLMSGDLHTHTNFSDGSLDIEQLPRLAARAGLTHLAVSDHDTGLSAAYALAHPCVDGVSLIPAVELTCQDTKRSRCVHILCYYPTLTPQLEAYFSLMQQRRNDAAEKTLVKLTALYPQVTREDAFALAARSGTVYKAHLSRLLFEYGYTDGVYKQLYRDLFGRPDGKLLCEPGYEPLETVLQLIAGAGGVAVVAHPSVYRSMELCEELAAAGRIDGVEIDHSRNTPEDKAWLQELAQQYNLIVTGGTDFHGLHMARPTPLGALFTTRENIDRIATLAAARKCDFIR